MKFVLGAVLAAIAAGCAAPPPGLDDLDLQSAIKPIPGTVRCVANKVEIESPAILRADDQHVWGGSVVRGNDGRYHMFVSRFRADAESRGFSNEWLLSSEIAHAVSKHPDRDYEFTGIALRGRRLDGDAGAWDAQGVHNPHVRRFGDRC